MDKLLEENSSEIIRIFYKCGESIVRSSLEKIASVATNKLFESDKEEDQEKAKKFMQNMINSIPTDAAQNWTKFEQFFNLIMKVTIAGERQLEHFKQMQLETLLADFLLAERSPLRQGNENRLVMGNNYSNPNFDALVTTV
jgi:hypothetical protein